MKTTRIRAIDLTCDMTFRLLELDCVIVSVEKIDRFDLVAVKFKTNTNEYSIPSRLVLPTSFEFTIDV